MRRVWRQHEHVVARNPARFFEQVSEGKAELLIAEFARHPISLHVVRAGRHRNAFLDSRRIWFGLWFRALPADERLLFQSADVFPVRIHHLHEEFILPPREMIGLAVQCERHVRKVSAHCFRGSVLRHASVKAAMPGGVLIGMARTAGFRTHVTGTAFRGNFLEQLSARCHSLVGPRLPGEAAEQRRRQKQKRSRARSPRACFPCQRPEGDREQQHGD